MCASAKRIGGLFLLNLLTYETEYETMFTSTCSGIFEVFAIPIRRRRGYAGNRFDQRPIFWIHQAQLIQRRTPTVSLGAPRRGLSGTDILLRPGSREADPCVAKPGRLDRVQQDGDGGLMLAICPPFRT